MNPTLRGVLDVSGWVPLERGAYEAGTGGLAITFASCGNAPVVLAVRLAGRFLRPDA